MIRPESNDSGYKADFFRQSTNYFFPHNYRITVLSHLTLSVKFFLSEENNQFGCFTS